jgi:hypothetical protein
MFMTFARFIENVAFSAGGVIVGAWGTAVVAKAQGFTITWPWHHRGTHKHRSEPQIR